MYTDGTSYNNGLNQAVIYLQAGVAPARYNHTKNESSEWPRNTTYDINIHSNFPTYTLVSDSERLNVETSGYVNTKNIGRKKMFANHKYLSNVDMSTQGIGSGAGYIEVSNGTYTIIDN